MFQIDGYPTKHPITLIWQGTHEVVRDLGMSYGPHVIFDGLEREFSEWMTGDSFFLQDLLPEGTTIVPIIAASDKTPVMRHTGDLKMHPLFITIGNIQSNARMRVMSHAWRCVAYLPVPEFNVHPDYVTILGAHLIHKCLDLIFTNCKIATQVGQFMPDPCGNLHYSFPPLVSYQQMLLNVAKNASPVSTAVQQQFGDPFPHPPRTGQSTLKLIHELVHMKKIEPWDLDKFQKELKKVNLLGVHQPFCQHNRVGVSHVKQMTGREHRDIQQTIVATIASPAPPQFVRVIRALIDFIYLTQNHVHMSSTIQKMVDALAEFHEHKDIILQTKAQRGKKGAKLELLQNFARLMSYSTNISECLLITHCKDPFERTNCQCQNFTNQIIEEKYQIKDFGMVLSDYIDNHANANPHEFNHWNPNYRYLCAWYKFRIQLRSVLKP
ncbi:hypothetical protein BV22DRAFT_1108432 [Leucogyrophana mollusca]|uniref:Uncharacterized protein n=1 Tax=Leucogyrophana mollusca TaxID=85980 RepID=A0ACB8AXA1_9AGAM|nr:hypothetical protein BV22DRAFT_1108432 [Leucogyrophana mollusca]